MPRPAIPELDLAMMATELPEPIVKWGSIARSSRMNGTYHHFCDDYKMTGHWKTPDKLPDSGCRVAVEPNYSTLPTSDPEHVRAGIFRKRSLAYYWQTRGVRIVADLNVDPVFRVANFEGIPRGWRAYAVRSQSGIPAEVIEADHEAAVAHAGTANLLFVVFGGWKRIRDLCASRGWQWVPENIHAARGSTDCVRRWK